jgi:hypothetical protein
MESFRLLGVVAEEIPITFLGIELRREAANLPLCIGSAALAAGRPLECMGRLRNLYIL